jgi:hypothetical protein
MNGAEVTKLARQKWPELLIVFANDFGAANVRFPPIADIPLAGMPLLCVPLKLLLHHLHQSFR